MEKKINLINKFHAYKFPAEILYNTEENDKYNFTVKMKGEKGKEYAVLFVNGDESFYTAEILDSAAQEKIFQINKLKIAKCEKIRIVDIETEQTVYEADFKISANEVNYHSNDDIIIDSKNEIENGSGDIAVEINGKTDNENDTDENQIIELSGPAETERQTKPNIKSAVKIKSMISETQTDKETLENADKIVLDEEVDFYADYEKDSSQSSAISDDEQDSYDIDLFMDNTIKSPEISKAQKASLINDNEGILDEIFEKFDLFETPLKNHVFYKLDETNTKKSALKIILNGFIVPLLSPLLEYKNPFGTSGNYPKYLIGETVIDGETEYYVYGTLGRNLREEQPFSGATGFVYFEKIKDSEEGYWLMYVNAKTGRISLPIRPKSARN